MMISSSTEEDRDRSIRIKDVSFEAGCIVSRSHLTSNVSVDVSTLTDPASGMIALNGHDRWLITFMANTSCFIPCYGYPVDQRLNTPFWFSNGDFRNMESRVKSSQTMNPGLFRSRVLH